jgi:hypothetical protein
LPHASSCADEQHMDERFLHAAQFIRSSVRCPQRSSLHSSCASNFCADDSAFYSEYELSLRFKFLQRLAQACLVRFAHLA